MCLRPFKQRAVLNEIRHCVFFSISPVCASIPNLKSDVVPTSACMTIFGPRSVAVSSAEPCPEFARPKEQQPLQFSNTNGKFTGFSFVWEAATCQRAALSIEVTFCVRMCVCMCVCLISLPACFLKHLNLKANYETIHSISKSYRLCPFLLS